MKPFVVAHFSGEMILAYFNLKLHWVLIFVMFLKCLVLFELSFWEDFQLWDILGSMFVNCLVSLVVLSATAAVEVLGSIPTSSKKCYWVFL